MTGWPRFQERAGTSIPATGWGRRGGQPYSRLASADQDGSAEGAPLQGPRLLQQLWPQLWGWRKGVRASPAWPARGGGSGAGIPAPTPAT